jgi:NAD(P)H-dependent flavin oxidoreductase YrpB (nitropropane dioxygenase family)
MMSEPHVREMTRPRVREMTRRDTVGRATEEFQRRRGRSTTVRTHLCERLGMEFPIFAFSHCRDVVAAVANSGGFGVLGAIGFSPEELEQELRWIDEHVGDLPYGVDIVIPSRYEGMGETDPAALEARLAAMVPDDHRRFARRLLDEHGVPELPPGEQRSGMMGWTEATARPLLEVALRHPKVRLVANALGTPPRDVIEEVQATGRLMAALAGSVRHALRHKQAGVDVVICQGSEGGGHTGEVGSVVLWPEVIDALAPLPVLAAGGIGSGRQIAAAMAMGAAGVWTGTLWLTVQEADIPPAQMQAYLTASSSDTVRSRSFTGKPCRMLKNDWTEAWDRPDTPEPLPMPLQMLVAIEAVSRGRRYPEQAAAVNFNPCGQVIGRATRVRRVREVMASLVEEYVEAVERMHAGLASASAMA